VLSAAQRIARDMMRFAALSTSYRVKKNGHPESGYPYFRQQIDCLVFLELFLDTRGLAGQLAQVVQLGTAYRTLALDLDRPD